MDRQRGMADPAWLLPRLEIANGLPLSVKVERIIAWLVDLDRGMRDGSRTGGDEEEAGMVALVEALHRDMDFTIRVGRGLALKRLGNSITLEVIPEEVEEAAIPRDRFFHAYLTGSTPSITHVEGAYTRYKMSYTFVEVVKTGVGYESSWGTADAWTTLSGGRTGTAYNFEDYLFSMYASHARMILVPVLMEEVVKTDGSLEYWFSGSEGT